MLDLASGPGVLASAAAAEVQGGLVVASDIAEGALREGRRRAVADNLVFVAADAERLTFADGVFDRVLCGLGLMFFPAAEQSLAEMRRVLKPGGLAVFSVVRARRRRRLGVMPCPAYEPHPAPPPKAERLSPFRFGSRPFLKQTLEAAGFREVELHTHTLSCVFATPQDYWQA
ncbi:MAG: methyltransferase domain-containing protein, partial [Rhodospirillales bacterium]|nr:methyltransferase domain-containing protein [Rhodospirillales bacterium]